MGFGGLWAPTIELGISLPLVVVSLLFLIPIRSVQAQNSFKLPEEVSEEKASNSDFEMPEVNVDGSESESNSGRSFLGKFIDHEISKETIDGAQTNNLGDLVDQVPGVDNLGGPRKESQKIVIRGFQENQVLQLLDGTRQNFQMEHNSIIPVRNHLLKRLDIMKGGASSRFGNGALGGLINFQTMDARDFQKSNDGKSLQLRNALASNNGFSQWSLTNGLLFDKSGTSGLLLDVTSTNTGDVELSDGSDLTFSAYEDQSVWGKTHFQLGKNNKFWVSAEQMTKDSSSPFNPTGGVFTANDVAEQKELFQSYRANYKLTGSARYRPELVTYYSKTEMNRIRRTDRRNDTRTTETTGFSYHSTLDVVRDQENFRLDLQPGVELYRDANTGIRDDGELSNFPTGSSVHQGYYLQANAVAYEKLWLQSGVRFDEVRMNGASLDFAQVNNEWSPEVELGFQVNDNLAFTASYEEGYNAPEIQQMFPSGIHFPSGPFSNNVFIPNPDLRPEDSETVEVKMLVDWELARENSGSFRFSVFETDTRNYIEQVVSLIDNTTQSVNRDLVEQTGYEIELWQRVGNFDFSSAVSQVRAEKSFERRPLSQSPADQFLATVGYRKDKWGVGVQRQQFMTQDRIDPAELENIDVTPGFELYNIYADRKFSIGKMPTQLRLRANNVFNTEHRRHGTPLLGAGSDFRVEMRIAL